MGRILVVASAKGGVGKTTLVSNLAAALAHYNKSVVAIDANLTTSNLGLHLGIHLYPVTLQDVLKGKARIQDAAYPHSAGFSVIPADISLKKMMTPKSHDLFNAFYSLAEHVDFIIIDSAAGLGQEALAAIEAADEVITISHPELPSLTDALKLTKIASKYETKNIGLVLNMVRNKKYEFSHIDATEFLDIPLLGKIHDDHNVRKAISKKMPVVVYKPRCKASRQIKAIARRLIEESYIPETTSVHRFFGWLLRHDYW